MATAALLGLLLFCCVGVGVGVAVAAVTDEGMPVNRCVICRFVVCVDEKVW